MAMDRVLSRSERNRALELIRSNGFDPSEFVWQAGSTKPPISAIGEALVHTPTGSYLVFGWTVERQYCIEAFPSPSDRGMEVQFVQIFTLEDRVGSYRSFFESWLRKVKHEADQFDLWAAVEIDREISGAPWLASVSTAPFTSDESASVRHAMSEIATFLRSTHEIHGETLARIESRLEYLGEASERISKKDWILAMLGVLVSMAAEQVITQDTGREMLRIIRQWLGGILGWTPTLPSGLG